MRVGQADSQEARVPPAQLRQEEDGNVGGGGSSDSCRCFRLKLTAMISALEMVGAMLLMNREQVLWRGRGRGESSLAFFSSFFSSLALSFGFSSSLAGQRRRRRRERWLLRKETSITAPTPHLHPPLPRRPCLPPLPSSWVYPSSWSWSPSRNRSRCPRHCLRRRCRRCASSSSSADRSHSYNHIRLRGSEARRRRAGERLTFLASAASSLLFSFFGSSFPSSPPAADCLSATPSPSSWETVSTMTKPSIT